jgi:acylpyruvate hydrolase
MKLVTLQDGRPGVLIGGDAVDASGVAPSMRGILERGDAALDQLKRLLDRPPSLIRAPVLAAPIPDPGVILSAGLNYHAHLREMNTPAPEQPTAFFKSPTAVTGPGQPIVLPPAHPDMVDWEGEFSAVIGRPCHNVSEAEALDYVVGYTLINDVSARDWVAPVFQAQGIMGPIQAWERNILGKQFPTFCPLGPVIVTRDEVPDPDDVDLTTSLNGKAMQVANTGDLVFNIPRLIAYFSRFMRFRPGDVITTGSPAGVGYGRNPKVFMKPGDTVEVAAKGVGVLSNPVRSAL